MQGMKYKKDDRHCLRLKFHAAIAANCHWVPNLCIRCGELIQANTAGISIMVRSSIKSMFIRFLLV